MSSRDAGCRRAVRRIQVERTQARLGRVGDAEIDLFGKR